MVHKSGPTTYLLATAAGIGLVTTGYLGMRALDQDKMIDNQTLRMNEQLIALQTSESTVASLEADLGNLKNDLEDLLEDYEDELDRNKEFEGQIMDLAGSLDEFEKLQDIDEELLSKYSKVSFLNENYVPSRIKQIDDDYVMEGKDDQYFHGDAMRFLERMFDSAKRDDIDLKIISAYRSFDEQNELKGQFTEIFGEGANAFSADQGFSEHQLGTTIDITIPAVGGTFTSFGETEAFEWLVDNAHNYGFILSYPENNTFYIYEPWHWRFVGRDLARDLDRNDERTFYTLDQREINKYLLEIFD
ncbi:MAG: LAS superfamily LD-carboxypeptidase LdcB [Candidatus Paceibacteria bacterium]|jgi:LAS superfamily LD-carboxypeptidase LdcB